MGAAFPRERSCLRAEPFMHGLPEDPSFPSRVDALVASLMPLPQRPCIWDDSEFLIKVSVHSEERVLIMGSLRLITNSRSNV